MGSWDFWRLFVESHFTLAQRKHPDYTVVQGQAQKHVLLFWVKNGLSNHILSARSAVPSSWMERSTPQEALWAARVQPLATWRRLTLALTLGHSCSHCPVRSSDTAVWSLKSTSRAAEGGSDWINAKHQPSSSCGTICDGSLEPGRSVSDLWTWCQHGSTWLPLTPPTPSNKAPVQNVLMFSYSAMPGDDA